MRHVNEELSGIIKKLNASAPKPLTPASRKFVEGCEVIRQSPLDGEPAFMARQLIQCTLPHSNPGDVAGWSRRNGDLILTIQAGWDGDKKCSMGYPYGTIPRLLLFWIIREILRTKSRRLELGHSLSDFMRELGLTPASARGGKRSDGKRLKEQMRRLFNCRISFQGVRKEAHRQGERMMYMEVAPDSELWWDLKEPEQAALWGSWIEVGEKFFGAVIQSPVPVDMRALKLLKNSALALDLYAWCVWRADYARRTGEKQFIAWKTLMHQMGCEYSGDDAEKNFKRIASAALRKVKLAYPALKTSAIAGGFAVLPTSGTAIEPRAPRRKKVEA